MKIKVSVSTRLVGSKVTEIIELDDDMSEDELEDIGQQTMFDMIDWNWERVE